MSKTWDLLDLLTGGVLASAIFAGVGALGHHSAHESIKDDCDKINATVIDGKAYQCWRADLEVEGAARKEF